MNKQELIAELTKYVKRYEDEMDKYAQGRFGAYKVALALTRQLDEPQKPVVPKCVEPFLKEAKCSTDVIQLFVDILHATGSDSFIWENWKWTADFYEWLAKDSDTLYILGDALRYGYEVEKEPLYYIKLSSTYNTFLVESDDGDLIVWQNTDRGTPFTEKRIKAIDERYWPFAVPVEEG